MTDSRRRAPWDAPDCPLCGALHIYVDRFGGGDPTMDWRCFKCESDFHARVGFRVDRSAAGAGEVVAGD